MYQRIRDDSRLDPYKLPYTQRNLAGTIDAALVTAYFPERPEQQTFIQQFRQTYLPFDAASHLEYAISYKLPEFWGCRQTQPMASLSQNCKHCWKSIAYFQKQSLPR